jgi:hypothetical protein
MLASNLSEAKKNCIEITDFSPAIVEQLLQFIYNSEIPLEEDAEQAEELVAAADKYEINKLKVNCNL